MSPSDRLKPRVVAIIAAHNEADVIGHVIGDLIAQAVEVYLIDDGSTDDTAEQAQRWLGRGLIGIDQIRPADSPRYIWRELLRRKEEIARQLNADWYIHTDADEFREAPWPGMKLQDAIGVVDAAGCNAIDFRLLNFRFTNDQFSPGTDVRESLTLYEDGAPCDEIQIKAWKHNPAFPVDLVSTGGHAAEFVGRCVFPIKFLLRHYPLRSTEQQRRKIAVERRARFDPIEVDVGWHLQYDDNSQKVEACDQTGISRLRPFDPIETRLSLLTEATTQPDLYSPFQTRLLAERDRLRGELITQQGHFFSLEKEHERVKLEFQAAATVYQTTATEHHRVNAAHEEVVAELQRVGAAHQEVVAELRRALDALQQLVRESQAEVESIGMSRDHAVAALRLHHLFRSKSQICIWGAGSGGRLVMGAMLMLGLHPAAFLDSDPKKAGRRSGGVLVHTPAILDAPEYPRETTGVVVASIAHKAIAANLDARGWLAGTDYVVAPVEVLALIEGGASERRPRPSPR